MRTLRSRVLAVVVGLGAAAGVSLVFAPAASAHPLGNFTTNTAISLRLSSDRIDVRYAIDTAEIPTVRAKAAIDTDGDGTPSDAELAAYRETTCAAVAKATEVQVDGKTLALRLTGGDEAFAAGAAGLQTMRLDCTMTASTDLSSDDHRVTVTNG